MARNEIWVDAPPRTVFSVLADPPAYADWVVGASEVGQVEGDWPEPGALFHHAQGSWPLKVRDTTSALEREGQRRLRMKFRVRPWLVGEVDVRLRASRGGTRVVLTERPTGGLLGWFPNPGLDALIWLRNLEALRRLKRLAEERRPTRRSRATTAAR